MCRFESQLLAVKERLEAAKQGSTRGLNPTSPASNFAGNPFGRIAKPLRGGGAGAGTGIVGSQPAVPTFAGLQAAQQQEAGAGKRSSWFFNQRT